VILHIKKLSVITSDAYQNNCVNFVPNDVKVK